MDRSQVNIRLDQERKTEWESYVEQSPEVDSLSNLIRTAVAREMRTEGHSPVRSSPDGLDRLHDRLTTIQDTLTEIQESQEETEERVDRLADAVETDRALAEIAPEVFAHLPEYSGRDDAMQRFVGTPVDAETGEKAEGYGTVEWLADRTGITPERTQSAIDKLQRDTGRIRSVEIDGHRHYWKEV